ncbi:hypothetical protein KC951_00455 [Candidatus Saccharibacteria bacterium]|nr:hypothetical protein [Candidatus Saccharibacteria bacterium]
MKRAITKIRPASGFSHFLHLLFVVLLPLLIYVFVRINLAPLAVGLVFLSKWRMFAVRPRHWLANLRANSVDIMVGISIIIFMSQTTTTVFQLIWAAVYALWLLLIKPSTTLFGVSIQALIAQVAGLMAVYTAWGGSPLYVLVLATWVTCYVAARHFFTSFDEPYSRFLSDTWGYFGAALAWVLGHWLLYYNIVAQPALLLSVIGFGLAAMYYLENTDRLSSLLRRQFVFIMVAIIVVVLVFSDWGDKAI